MDADIQQLKHQLPAFVAVQGKAQTCRPVKCKLSNEEAVLVQAGA